MNSNRRAILELLAAGRIDAAEAERLIAATSADRETLWALVGCSAIAVAAQLHAVMPELAHLLRSSLAGCLPALEHAFTVIALSWGGRL
ncbi:MAG: hypothetical protein WBE76_17575 [Terracidiphilus sp.]